MSTVYSFTSTHYQFVTYIRAFSHSTFQRITNFRKFLAFVLSMILRSQRLFELSGRALIIIMFL